MFKYSLAFLSSLLLLSNSVSALNPLSNLDNNLLNIPNKITQSNNVDISKSVYNLSKQITVEITTNNNRGSGTLLSKNNNTYLVLTNAHVTDNSNTITLKTHDGNTHQGTLVNNPIINTVPDNYDLAIIQFTSEENYTIPTESINIPSKNNPIISAGYVAETGEYLVTAGKVTHTLTKSFKEGYSIGYTNNIKQGMSGGPILNSMGELIGINGRSAYPILNIGYGYPDETIPTDEQIQEYRQVSWGIPINTLLTHIQEEIAIAYNLPLPQTLPNIEPNAYTGYMAELEAKAKQFVVKIDSSSQANGSGVIIAKEGNIYTVLTTNHVLCEKGWNAIANDPCIEQYNYTITTHDGKTRNIDKSTIIRQQGIDLAVFTFESEENYAVAELADYNPQVDEYVFVVGFPKIGNNEPQFFLSGGEVHEKEQALIATLPTREYLQKQQLSLLETVSFITELYDLAYTSITYGGMSGAAVLDAQGRVMGIHGVVEGTVGGNRGFGYSLGIPIQTFVASQDLFNLNSLFLTTTKPKISQQQRQEISNTISDINIADTRATAKVWIERGAKLWRLGRHEQAVKAYEQSIKQNDPDNVYLAWYGKGLALASNQQYQGAITAFEQAINTLPSPSNNDYSAWFHSNIFSQQSVVYRYLEEYEKALTAIDQGIQLSPNNPNYYNEKWKVLYQLNRYDEALKAINQGIQLAPRAVWYSHRGLIYNEQEKFDLALADFNKAIQLNPNLATVYYNRGLVYEQQEKFDFALSDFTKAIELEPNNILAYNSRGLLYKKQEKFDFALADFNQVSQLNPNNILAYNSRGVLYLIQKQFDLALADFNTAIQIDPNYAEAYKNRGLLYKKQEQWDLALADYNKVLEIESKSPVIYLNRGIIYSNQQQWDLALADFNQAINLNHLLTDAYLNRGIIHEKQKQFDLALYDFNTALETNPNYSITYKLRGNVFYKQKKWDLALADYNSYILFEPNNDLAYVRRGLVYFQQKQWDLALADYNKALEINPNQAEAYMGQGLLYFSTEQLPKAITNAEKAAKLYSQQGDTMSYQKAQQLLNLIEQKMNTN